MEVIREIWSRQLERLVTLPIELASEGKLKQSMPICGSDSQSRYEACTHLEFVGRTLSGIAPLIELDGGTSIGLSEDKLFAIVDNITNPQHPDYLNFSEGTQPLVDAAFLALSFVRSPKVLWGGLPDSVKRNVITELRASRKIKPHFNNWLLFSAMIEAFFFMAGEYYDRMRIDYALKQHEQWYLGDGHYGDGVNFRADYYNSYVILPLLLEITALIKGEHSDWQRLDNRSLERAKRYAEVQERMISPSGTFPPIGRSLAYRGGAFHLLALMSFRKRLPHSLSYAQVRSALTAVIDKTLSSDSNYDENGWLRIGLNGYQPSIGENYISTGSLYLTSLIFLPLGLDARDEFWTALDEPWTQQKIWWTGDDISADRAL